MVEPKEVLIILPAYNEEKVIGQVIRDIRKEGFTNLVVIDDCSKDNTFKVAQKEEVVVLRHVINRGAGAATATGLEYAKRNGFNYAITMDSDGQHSAQDAKNLMKYADKFDVIIGSRLYGRLDDMPVHRRVANIIGSLVTYVFFGLYVRDSQSGMKFFNREAIAKIRITFDRYEFCSEMIGEIKRNRLRFREVPIKIIYTDHSQAKGQSIGNGFKMVMRFLFRN